MLFLPSPEQYTGTKDILDSLIGDELNRTTTFRELGKRYRYEMERRSRLWKERLEQRMERRWHSIPHLQ